MPIPLTLPTPHIAAPPGAFAPDVLLPGDPLRARHIADTLLEGAERVTAVRGMLGFTGRFRGRRVSVMGTGMGMASTAIYATELVRGHGVRRLLRVGTCGAVADGLALGDIVLALGAGTDSSANRLRFAGHDFPATASWPLLQACAAAATATGIALRVGNIFSTELFYGSDPQLLETLRAMGILALDMEAAGLFAVAAQLGAQAGALLTVSDHLRRGEHWDAGRRERGVDPMLLLALQALQAG